MLPYLIKITDNTLSVTIALAFLLSIALKAPGAMKKSHPAWAAALGGGAAAAYAVLKRNTGWMVREYYDLGVLLPSLALSFFFLVLIRRPRAVESGAGRLVFRAALGGLIALGTAYGLPNLILYPFEFPVGMDNVFNADFLSGAG